MALYLYKAIDPGGKMSVGSIEAINLVDLEMRLKRMGLDFINGDLIKQRSGLNRTRITRPELITFCFHLEQLSRAGVPLIESLADLRDSLENPRFREIIAGMVESIEGGKTLSQAMNEHPHTFDEVMVSLIRAGEETGSVPHVLNNLLESLKWQDELAAHTKKLIMYPAFLGTVVVAVVMFMMIYLVPKMAGFIRNMGQALPLQTRILIATSEFFVNYWYVVIGLPILLTAGITLLVKQNPAARYRLDDIKLRLPWIGTILKKIILSRFASVFAMMYASGITILDSIKTTEDIVGNVVIKDGLKRAGKLIAEGQNVTAAFGQVELFPPLVLRMLRVGENTGALDTALTNVSYFYNRDVRESIEKVQAMIEPVMTVIIGLILGWIMLAVLGPIYDIITKMKT
ncbi:secretion system protein [Rugosibacter aromaticivorans]|uniref:Secretion system protein n=1 Tax=Rugosibacter aromaticivorans TaxID=1565605 RepID=A0A0C5JMX9_9PROT|nr:type II secretion system F family protein [Rugosibacter aromaticivorans]AJP48726.1 secretion system protein [Rugosibacter aromaticivorans]TBR14214.1 MAG: type II secretion system F family protein [Rugosibacter sp.]